MTHSACATRTDTSAKTHVAWRPPLRAAQTCLRRKDDTERARLSELNCDMSGSTFATRFAVAAATKHEDRRLARRIEGRCAHRTAHQTRVVPDGLGTTARLRDGVNGAALQFRPGGT